MREELFKPLTGRGPRNPSLTQENVKAREEQRSSSTGLITPRKDNASVDVPKSTPRTSLVMLELKKQRRFEDLFEQLDVNKNGLISENEMGLSNISTAILQLLSPVLMKVQAGRPMSREEFSLEC